MAGQRETTPKTYKDAYILRIRDARIATGLSQEKMALALGITQGRYKQYEKRSLLPHHLVPEFCRVTDLHPWFILTGQAPSRSPGSSSSPPTIRPVSSSKRSTKK